MEDVLISDHYCVFFDLECFVDPLPTKIKAERRIITPDAAERFSALFDPAPVSGCHDVDVFFQAFNSQCLEILDKVAPKKSNFVSHIKSCPWINESILSLKRNCRKVERLWKSSKLEVHRVHLRELRASLNDLMNNTRKQYFSQLISSSKRNPKILFDTINSIVSPISPQVPFFSKAESNNFLYFFVDKIKEVRANLSPQTGYFTGCEPPPTQIWSSFELVSLNDISTLLSKMKPSSCPVDVLPTVLFKKVFDVTGLCITEVLNTSMQTGVVPSFFKHAVVEPILKKSGLDPLQPKNYRPISKLPFLSKILEKIVAEQLLAFLDDNDIFDKFQSGFRKNHSTETALLKVSNDILLAADAGECTVLVLLDLSAAFDSVDHNILINRLQNLVGLSGAVLKWFSSYLTGRSFSVYVNHVMSDTTEMSCGVPQGSVLGPILFLLYMLPLGQLIRQFNNVSYHLYADDIQLYCSFKASEFDKLTSLLTCLNCIKEWLNDNYLQLNSEKTETLIIAPVNSVPVIKQHIGVLGASAKQNLRNLGVVFDPEMSLEHHSKILIRNCFFQLRNISKIRSLVSRPELEMIVHAFISSRLDYCNSLFTCLNKKSVGRLQTVQNAAARLLTNTRKREHITPVLASLHWLPIQFRIHFKILVLTFRALHGQAPQYISDLIQPYSPPRSLRSSGKRLLVVPHTHLKTRGDRSFQALAPTLWNDLPLSVRCLNSVVSFKKHLKTILFERAYSHN